MERLDKIIANRGIASRREVKELVRQGRVLVDGVPASAPDVKVSAETVAITVDGVPVSSERYTYLLLHKPAGVLTATEDKHQPTVMELLPESLRRRGLAPVGRLDKDTEGLLLLTDDGELTHRLLSPRYHVDKVYYAKVEMCIRDSGWRIRCCPDSAVNCLRRSWRRCEAPACYKHIDKAPKEFLLFL